MIRLTGGKYNRAILSRPEGHTTRPTKNRIRQSIFNILDHLYNRQWSNLKIGDVYAGTGAMGIEALSRGADFCYFWENDKFALKALTSNLKKLNLEEKSDLFKDNVEQVIRPAPHPLDLIFMDPPYEKTHHIPKLCEAFYEKGWFSPQSRICIESSSFLSLPENFQVEDQRTFGKTKVRFYFAS